MLSNPENDRIINKNMPKILIIRLPRVYTRALLQIMLKPINSLKIHPNTIGTSSKYYTTSLSSKIKKKIDLLALPPPSLRQLYLLRGSPPPLSQEALPSPKNLPEHIFSNLSQLSGQWKALVPVQEMTLPKECSQNL